jgi:hypothetical protein
LAPVKSSLFRVWPGEDKCHPGPIISEQSPVLTRYRKVYRDNIRRGAGRGGRGARVRACVRARACVHAPFDLVRLTCPLLPNVNVGGSFPRALGCLGGHLREQRGRAKRCVKILCCDCWRSLFSTTRLQSTAGRPAALAYFCQYSTGAKQLIGPVMILAICRGRGGGHGGCTLAVTRRKSRAALARGSADEPAVHFACADQQ